MFPETASCRFTEMLLVGQKELCASLGIVFPRDGSEFSVKVPDSIAHLFPGLSVVHRGITRRLERAENVQGIFSRCLGAHVLREQ
ncbi:hypothetical protein CB1_001066020 [Camelus ferus]|nr:hypothetical protein CB1_001066020 [Camelus ferus]